MHDHLRRRFWVETGLALASGALCLLTIFWNDWIEIVFSIDPDHDSGSLEWQIVVGSLAMTIAMVALARQEWRRSAGIASAEADARG